MNTSCLPPPKPPALPKFEMPIPEAFNHQSRTMQHALAISTPNSANKSSNPLAGLKPPPRAPQLNRPLSDQPKGHARRRSSPPQPSPPPKFERARSAPLSPTRRDESDDDDDPDRCIAQNKTGTGRCGNRRKKKTIMPIQEYEPDYNPPPFICHVHRKPVAERGGAYSIRRLEVYKESAYD